MIYSIQNKKKHRW